MRVKDWRETWEQYAIKEREEFDNIPLETLLENIKSGNYGDYYNIWYSIAGRSDLKTVGWIFFDILNLDIDYLLRYHCAAALLTFFKKKEYEPVQLSSEKHNFKENLKAIEKLLEQNIGAR